MSAADYVIWSFEHRAWWRPGRWGYTDDLEQAGRYTRREAEAIVADANIVQEHERALSLEAARRDGIPRRPALEDMQAVAKGLPLTITHTGTAWRIQPFDRQQTPAYEAVSSDVAVSWILGFAAGWRAAHDLTPPY